MDNIIEEIRYHALYAYRTSRLLRNEQLIAKNIEKHLLKILELTENATLTEGGE